MDTDAGIPAVVVGFKEQRVLLVLELTQTAVGRREVHNLRSRLNLELREAFAQGRNDERDMWCSV